MVFEGTNRALSEQGTRWYSVNFRVKIHSIPVCDLIKNTLILKRVRYEFDWISQNGVREDDPLETFQMHFFNAGDVFKQFTGTRKYYFLVDKATFFLDWTFS